MTPIAPPGYPPINPYGAPAGYVAAPPPPANLGAFAGALQHAVALGPSTDEHMSGAWVALIILAPFLGIGVAFLSIMTGLLYGLGFFGLVLMAFFVPAIIIFMFFYKQLTRMTAHFDREAAVRRAIIEYLKARAALSGRAGWIDGEVANMEALNAQAMAGDERQPGALAILAFIPIAKWYVLYVLTKWPHLHVMRWSMFAGQAAAAGAKLGIPVAGVAWNAMPKRSFGLYLVATLLTAGFFGIYWYIVLCNDPNDHFRTHQAAEASFVASFR